MTYAIIAAAFLGIAALTSVVMARSSQHPKVNWRAVTLTGVGLVILTAIFDNIMIGSGLFSYESSLISGLKIGLAPIEDFSYPLATAIGLPALWVLLRQGPYQQGTDQIGPGLWSKAFVSSRPISWINTAFPFAAGYFLTTGAVDWVLLVGALYYLIPYNLAMYGINDVFDYESDLNNPRKGGLEGALLPTRLHRPIIALAVITNVPFIAILIAVGGWWTALAIGWSTFALIAYSAPKLRFKERPVLDSITSSTHFVSPAVVGLTLASAVVEPATILILVAFFFWGMAAHAFGAVQDIVPDRAANIGSIATRFGAASTVRIAIGLWVIAGLLMIGVPWPGSLAGLVVIPYILNCLPWINVTDAQSGDTNRAWRRFIWLNFFSGFAVTMIMIMSVWLR